MLGTALRYVRHVDFCLRDRVGLGGSRAERKRFNHALFISPDRSFLFAKNEKCANISARATLQKLAGDDKVGARAHDTKRWLAPLLQPSDLGLCHVHEINKAVAFKFAIIRNPFSRILSCYLNKFAPRAKKHKMFVERAGGREDMTFGEFVESVSRQEPQEMDPHWRVQYDNLYCDVISYDRLLRFETLGCDFADVLRTIAPGAQDLALQYEAHTSYHNASAKIAQYYTPAIAERVRETFAKDFEQFGYSRDLPA